MVSHTSIPYSNYLVSYIYMTSFQDQTGTAFRTSDTHFPNNIMKKTMVESLEERFGVYLHMDYIGLL